MDRIFIFFVLLIMSFSIYAGNPVSVPLDHPVYPFLDRMETLGLLENIRDGVKPFDRERISQLLIKLRKKYEFMTSIDRQRLDNLLLDFRFDIDRSERYLPQHEDKSWHSPLMSYSVFRDEFNRLLQRNQPEEENHVILWEDSLNSFYFDFIADYTFDVRSDDLSRSRQSETYRFRGSLGENFGYALDISFFRIFGDDGYRDTDPVLKATYNTERDNKIFFDRSGGDLAYRTSFLDFRFAHQPTTWGLGSSGILILSDNAEQYAYLSVAKHWDWGSFIFMHGKLLAEQSGISEEGQNIMADKWIAINRFEFSPVSSMSIGLSDIVIYGNRSLEWAYLVPFNFFRATEHNLGDRDNALLAIDAEFKLIAGLKLYGTILLDELKTSELFTDWFGNKHGFQFGTHVTDPLRIPNLNLRFEYTAIMPWVYTHKFDINRFTNDGKSLGHWAGPNSQIVYGAISKAWHHRLTTQLSFTRWEKGGNFENENIGGDIFLGRDELLGDQTEPRQTRKFLEGILQTESRWQLDIQYELFNDLFIDLRLSNLHMKRDTIGSDYTEYHFGIKFDY